jgi:hypothetical protein
MLAMALASCGLSQRERAIAEANAQIMTVDEASQALARAIYDLPEAPSSGEHFAGVMAAYRGYRQEVDRLYLQIHQLGEVIPELNAHIRESFDPEVSDAMDRCEAAVTVFEQPQASEEAYREALTSLCLCVERHAAAVTAVSREYARLAG